jgi:hypothetical protein
LLSTKLFYIIIKLVERCMRTEEAVQRFWEASLLWKGREPTGKETTVEELFRTLSPIEEHVSPLYHVSSQAASLSREIVKMKRSRPGKRKRGNVVPIPMRSTQKRAVA